LIFNLFVCYKVLHSSASLTAIPLFMYIYIVLINYGKLFTHNSNINIEQNDEI